MTINEIAKLAGVSISTVSKVINNKDSGVNSQTREHVLNIVKEYNYRPYYAKNIASGDTKSFLLGVVFSTLPPPILWGIRQCAQEKGYIVFILYSNDNQEMELKQLSSLLTHNLDGLIWEPVDPRTTVNRAYVEALNIPYLTIAQCDDNTAYHMDYTGLGYFLTEQLIAHRHTNIACLVDSHQVYSDSVLEGFKRCLHENGIAFTDNQIQTADSISEAMITHKFSGVVSTSFMEALRFYKIMTDLNYHIPDDVSIISVKEDTLGEIPYPDISSVNISFQDIGKTVCKQLIDKCESKEEEPVPFLFPFQPVLSSKKSISLPPEIRRKKIIVVGSLNIDLTFNVEALPVSGMTTLAASSLRTLGGKGANQAVGAARLGQDVMLLAKVGNDTEATMALTHLGKENVSTVGIFHDSEAPTGIAFIQQQKDGESTITVLPGANSKLLPADIEGQQHMFSKAGFCLLSTETAIDTIIAAARLAVRNNVKTIIKPAALHSLPDQLLEYADIFIPNESEARILCGSETMSVEDQARYFREKGASTVIITLGERGCYYLNNQTSGLCPASNSLTIDTTGGADAFISALASYLLDGFSLEQAIRIATYAAGFCISRVGVSTALIDKLTLENYVRCIEPELLNKDLARCAHKLFE